ncbi:MAG: ribonuclease H-like YkuK family protein [Candidatus Atribacteria bacterium]|nr:ribonuclease H-like YkuK family protein [Candidatus Atribacteria bacterium]
MDVSERFYFYNFALEKKTLDEVVKSLFDFIRQDPAGSYRIIIGTDSKGTKDTPSLQVFVTAIIVHKIGYGARFFWMRNYRKDRYGIRDRIYLEAAFSLEVSHELIHKLDTFPDNHLSNYSVEIHVDIGNNGPTRHLIQEVTGMIEGLGFVAKIKPDSYGASRVAHRYT